MYRIEKAAVIGAGTMGLGIAGQLAHADVDVQGEGLNRDSGALQGRLEKG